MVCARGQGHLRAQEDQVLHRVHEEEDLEESEKECMNVKSAEKQIKRLNYY